MPGNIKEVHPGKVHAARAAADLVEPGMAVGLGSGSTAAMVVRALGDRVANESLRFVGIPTSVATAELASSLKIPLREMDSVDAVDLTIDGADEVDPRFRMIKGRGGALLREKIVASFGRKRVFVVTPEKRVERLGESAPVPVEVSSIGVRHLLVRLSNLGATPTLRLRPDGSPYVTDGGNMIIDCRFTTIDDPASVHDALKRTVGVFETGLFIDLCDVLLVGHEDRVERIDACGQ